MEQTVSKFKILDSIRSIQGSFDNQELIVSERCTVSKNLLNELNKATKTVLSNVTKTVTGLKCELNADSTYNCMELIKQIQCGVSNLKNEYIKQTSTNSTAEITKLTSAYEDLYKMYIKSIDSAKQSAAQEYKLQLDKVKIEIQELKKALIEGFNEKTEVKVKLIISEIQSGKIGDAAKYYNEANYDSDLAKIIEISYNDYGGQKNVENILKFTQDLSNLNNHVTAYHTLFNLMERNSNLYSHQGFLFKYAVVESINALAYGGLPEAKKNMLLSLRDKLFSHTYQNKFQNGYVEEYTRVISAHFMHVTNYYEYVMSMSIEDCWSRCLSNSKCRVITYHHANRDPNQNTNVCYLYTCYLFVCPTPKTSDNNRNYFTTVRRNELSTHCNCPCLVIFNYISYKINFFFN